MECLKCKKDIDQGDLFCGYCGTNQEKFAKYLEKVSNKIHKQRDKEYNKKVDEAERELTILKQQRENMIETIKKMRWENCGSADFEYNLTEGILKINNKEYHFSDIKGAEIVKNDAYRVVTTSKGKSKKHVSLGKAAVGGVLLGPLGAVAGGVMGKTTSTGQQTSDSIPTCNHIGVNVDINGFTTEIVLLNNTVDQSSNVYVNKINEAQKIVDKLRDLSTTEEPKEVLKPEEEQSVLDYNSKIKEAEKELTRIKNDKPNYDIPEEYYR